MSGIQFLASSKPFIMPDEIEEYNDCGIYDEHDLGFSVCEAEQWWCEIVKPVLSLPYIYEAGGIGNYYFYIYLEKYMEIGDVIELYEIPVQHWHESYIQRVLEKPEPIIINIGSRTYENQYGKFQLHHKKWLEELKHRTLLTEHGVTTIINF